MAGFFGRMARRAGRAALGPVGRVAGKVIGTAFRMSPVGAAAGLGLAAFEGYRALTAGRGGGGALGPPSLPELPMGAMDAGAGMPTGAAGAEAPFALQATAAKGFAFPELTMDQMNAMQAAGLMTQFSELRVFRRSPRKDQVVVHPRTRDGQVMTFALNKKLAQKYDLWKPARKPPMSAGMWHAVQRANAAVKILQRMNRDVKKVANFGSRAKPQLRIYEAPGRKMIGRKAA